ncbi:MAG: hypothetical protein ACKOCN_06045, partial [Planctomycetaceae bacterium]
LSADGPLLTTLLVVGGVNTVLSLFYYLKVLKVMTFDPPPEEKPAVASRVLSISGALLTALAVPVLIFGIFWSGLYDLSSLAGVSVSRAAVSDAAIVDVAADRRSVAVSSEGGAK